jgi:putative aldouronate transport system substrate-binding protein
MKKRISRIMCLVITASVVLSMAGCKKTPKVEPVNNKIDISKIEEITVFDGRDGEPWILKKPVQDVVSAELEKKTGLKISQVFGKQGKATINDSLNALIASQNYPDIIYVDTTGTTGIGGSIKTLIDAGKILEIDETVKKKMPSLIKEIEPLFWSATKYNGKNYAVVTHQTLTVEDYKNPEFSNREFMMAGQPIYVREDILKDLGYKFKSTPDLEAIQKSGKFLTYEDMRVEGLETPEEFYEFLKKVKNSGMKVGNKDIIPLSQEWGELFTIPFFNIPMGFASRFDIMSNDEVKFMTNNPNFKEAAKYINKLTREGLLDPEWGMQSGDVKKAKIASGQVAAWFCWTDAEATKKALATVNPNYTVRVLNMIAPKGEKNPRQFNTSMLGGSSAYINKDSKVVDKIINMLEICFSDGEVEQLLTWGPESAGLWEVKDGKRKFKDAALQENFLYGTKHPEGKSMGYYGIMGAMAPAYRKDVKQKDHPALEKLPTAFQMQRKAANPTNFFNTPLAYIAKPKEVADFESKFNASKLMQKWYTKVWFAKNEEEFEKEFAAAQKGMETEGIKEAEEAWTKAYKEFKSK